MNINRFDTTVLNNRILKIPETKKLVSRIVEVSIIEKDYKLKIPTRKLPPTKNFQKDGGDS